jgi:hypothetical protein
MKEQEREREKEQERGKERKRALNVFTHAKTASTRISLKESKFQKEHAQKRKRGRARVKERVCAHARERNGEGGSEDTYQV